VLGRTTLSTSLLLALSLTAAAQEAPPGLVLVKGGKTHVGTDVKVIEKMIAEVNGARPVANTLIGETPKNKVEVDDFYLMPNEVTNEQYAEYVRAIGGKPPYEWGEAALDAGRKAFLEEQGRLRQEAREKGETPPARKTWDAAAWWDKNWQGQDWEVPSQFLDRPVNFISFDDARGYAAWAGLRLMTEAEFQRAGRGDSDNIYPWGNDWDPAACNSLDGQKADAGISVGSYANGAATGKHLSGPIFDLAGNLFEWTDSKYSKYEGYKPVKIKLKGKETLEPLAGFDPTMRVLVGGSFQTPGIGCRISFRQGADKSQTTEGIGFRCAADVVPGASASRYLIEEDVRLHVLPGDVEFKPLGSAVLQKWETKPGNSEVPGYGVISNYRRTLFTPVESIPAGSTQVLTRVSEEQGPVILGMLSFEHPLIDPELDGGTYFLGWRGEAKLKTEEEEETSTNMRVAGGAQDEAFWEVPGFNAELELFFLYDLEGSPIVAWPAPPLEFKKAKQGSSVSFEKFVPPTEPPAEDAPPIIPMDTVRFSIVVDGMSRKALHTTLELKIDPGMIDESWE